MSEEEDKKKENLKEGTLISHLLELRDRLMRMAIVLTVAFLPCVYYGNDVLTWLSRPLKKALPPTAKLVSTEVMGVFTTPFTLSFYVALAIVMPYLLYEIWGFVAPGLYKHEKRFAAPLSTAQRRRPTQWPRRRCSSPGLPTPTAGMTRRRHGRNPLSPTRTTLRSTTAQSR